MRKILFIVFILLLTTTIPHPRTTYAQRCDLPAGYLSDVNATFEEYGTAFAQVDIEDPAALAVFFIELSGVRQSYEEQAVDLPECGLRLHSMLVALLSTMQDTIGIAMAILTDPAHESEYLTSLQVSNARLEMMTARIEDEIETIQRPPIINVRYLNVQAANVRIAPDAAAGSLGVIEYGARIEVISLDLDQFDRPWYEFFFDDQRAWVLGELTVTEPPPPLPEFSPTPPASPTPGDSPSTTQEAEG